MQIRRVIKISGSRIGDANSVAAVDDRRTNLSGKVRRSESAATARPTELPLVRVHDDLDPPVLALFFD
jgi:hypothetical protein